jgi:hypothetical protein
MATDNCKWLPGPVQTTDYSTRSVRGGNNYGVFMRNWYDVRRERLPPYASINDSEWPDFN